MKIHLVNFFGQDRYVIVVDADIIVLEKYVCQHIVTNRVALIQLRLIWFCAVLDSTWLRILFHAGLGLFAPFLQDGVVVAPADVVDEAARGDDVRHKFQAHVDLVGEDGESAAKVLESHVDVVHDALGAVVEDDFVVGHGLGVARQEPG